MIDFHTYQLIHPFCGRDGLSIAQIARELFTGVQLTP